MNDVIAYFVEQAEARKLYWRITGYDTGIVFCLAKTAEDTHYELVVSRLEITEAVAPRAVVDRVFGAWERVLAEDK